MLEDWITTQEAVELTGYNPDHLRELIRSGRIRAKKFGQVWQVSRTDVLAYLKAAGKSEDKRRGPRIGRT